MFRKISLYTPFEVVLMQLQHTADHVKTLTEEGICQLLLVTALDFC